jgi:hypothetical protein
LLDHCGWFSDALADGHPLAPAEPAVIEVAEPAVIEVAELAVIGVGEQDATEVEESAVTPVEELVWPEGLAAPPVVAVELAVA